MFILYKGDFNIKIGYNVFMLIYIVNCNTHSLYLFKIINWNWAMKQNTSRYIFWRPTLENHKSIHKFWNTGPHNIGNVELRKIFRIFFLKSFWYSCVCTAQCTCTINQLYKRKGACIRAPFHVHLCTFHTCIFETCVRA